MRSWSGKEERAVRDGKEERAVWDGKDERALEGMGRKREL